VNSAATAAGRGLASCHLCCKLAAADVEHCPRCGAHMHQRKVDSLQRTLALLVTATILYVPANIYPIMITDQFGTSIESTILGGVVLLINLGSWPVALVIFVASVMVPLAKFFALYYLAWSVRRHPASGHRQRTLLYTLTELIGKWSMVDVFVVAILVALVHLGGFLVIRPGIAAVSFAGVVIVTMLAAHSFDPRLLWDNKEQSNG
jgi:paraquat-inducible protein A